MPPCGYTARLWLLLVPLGLFNVVSVVFSGFACLSNPCVHGVCLDDLNTTYSCYCIDGYTGVQCQTNWDECWSSPCQNGGVCIDGVASFNCSCAPGFVGNFCFTRTATVDMLHMHSLYKRSAKKQKIEQIYPRFMQDVPTCHAKLYH